MHSTFLVRRLAPAVLAIAFAAPVAAGMDPVVVDAAIALAKPLLVVPPDFPAHPLAAGKSVEVQVTGTISADGKLQSPAYRAPDGDEDFVEAVRKVIGLWRFIPAVDEDRCVPKESAATLSVWFETKDGAPSISVSAPKSAKPQSASTEGFHLEWDDRPQFNYPDFANRQRIEGECLTLLRVDASGKILNVAMRGCTPPGPFEDETSRGMEGSAYKPLDPATMKGKASICAQVDVVYCMPAGRGVKIPSARCTGE